MEAFSKIEEFIRQAEGEKARRLLEEILSGKNKRPHLAQIAQFAWRIGVPELGLRILNPIVRPTPKMPAQATPVETAEYAACLLKLGALDEADMILSKLDPSEVPEAPLYRAFALAPRWDYDKTIPLLERYIEDTRVDPYRKLVARVNLAQARIIEHAYQEADTTLHALRADPEAQKYRLLFGKIAELLAQSAIHQGFISEANEFLLGAGTQLFSFPTLDQLFVQKWRAIAKLKSEPDSLMARSELATVRKRAAEKKHWETVRECDRYLAVFCANTALANHLYFGTSSLRYRYWLLQDFPNSLVLDEVYEWRVQGNSAGPKLSLFESDFGFKTGKLLQQLCLTLLSDFYRPFSVATIFQRIYAGEYYHPTHSPDKVHDAIARLRRKLEEDKLPLRIEEHSGVYRFEAQAPCIVRIPRHVESDRVAAFSQELREAFSESPFTPKDVSLRTGLPLRTVQRLLKDAVSQGQLTRTGSGKATRYACPTPTSLRNAS